MQFKYKIGFIGAGNMAKAIVDGILSSKLMSTKDIIMSATKPNQYKEIDIVTDNSYVINNCECLIIAVKPQIFNNIASELHDIKSNIIVSIMAGKSINNIQNTLNTKVDVIRVMPNTPCKLKEGMTVITDNILNNNYKDLISNIFNSVGVVSYLDESKFDVVTSVSGSGPAYVYYFIKAMTEGGVAGGLDYDTSLALTLQTIKGGVEMAKNSLDSLDTLIEKVCSKGGTTIEAINTFNDKDMLDIVKDGMLKCKHRSEELSK